MLARPFPPLAFARSPAGWRRRWRRLIAPLWRAAAPDAGSWPSVRVERFTQYCRDCRDETSHEGFGEIGLGWFAQICRCRRCCRHSVKIWTCW